MAQALPKIYVEIYRALIAWDGDWLGYEALARRTGYDIKRLKAAVAELEYYPGYIEYYRWRDDNTGYITGTGYRIVPGKLWAVKRVVSRHDGKDEMAKAAEQKKQPSKFKTTLMRLGEWLLILWFVAITINSGILAIFHFIAGAIQTDYGRIAWSIIQLVTSLASFAVASYLFKTRIKK